MPTMTAVVAHLVGYTLLAAVPICALLVLVVAATGMDDLLAFVTGATFGLAAVIAGQLLFIRWYERQ